jgi:hypothetical protein
MLTPSTIYRWITIGPRMHWSGWHTTDEIEFREGHGDAPARAIGKQLEGLFHWRSPDGVDSYVAVVVTEKLAPVVEYLGLPFADTWNSEIHELVEQSKLGQYRAGLRRLEEIMEDRT